MANDFVAGPVLQRPGEAAGILRPARFAVCKIKWVMGRMAGE